MGHYLVRQFWALMIVRISILVKFQTNLNFFETDEIHAILKIHAVPKTAKLYDLCLLLNRFHYIILKELR